MKYYSLNRRSPNVDFKEATIMGQAPDSGLYFPETIPRLPHEFFDKLENRIPEDVAFDVIRPFVGGAIDEENLFKIVRETINFPIPLVQINDSIYSLELFHGPTLAFKDIGARFMSRCLGYFVQQGIQGLRDSAAITILVATSGDTGGAVADGFYGVEGVEVVILYPSGKVSPVQEKQLTALGKNIHALEVDGSFDDCQSMVKQAFADTDISTSRFLTSANSINIARWLPQQFYYFFAWQQWKDKEDPPVISVPSGNFGNICAGMLAAQSGLPVRHFIAALNANDAIAQYLLTGEYIPQTPIATLSNAMDVGAPSNFIRILEIFQKRYSVIRENLSAYRISDEDTLQTIASVYKEYAYFLDPHGAVGYSALSKYVSNHKSIKGIFLETAHPVKFPDAVERATGQKITIPASLMPLMAAEKKSIRIPAEYTHLKDYLLNS